MPDLPIASEFDLDGNLLYTFQARLGTDNVSWSLMKLSPQDEVLSARPATDAELQTFVDLLPTIPTGNGPATTLEELNNVPPSEGVAQYVERTLTPVLLSDPVPSLDLPAGTELTFTFNRGLDSEFSTTSTFTTGDSWSAEYDDGAGTWIPTVSRPDWTEYFYDPDTSEETLAANPFSSGLRTDTGAVDYRLVDHSLAEIYLNQNTGTFQLIWTFPSEIKSVMVTPVTEGAAVLLGLPEQTVRVGADDSQWVVAPVAFPVYHLDVAELPYHYADRTHTTNWDNLTPVDETGLILMEFDTGSDATAAYYSEPNAAVAGPAGTSGEYGSVAYTRLRVLVSDPAAADYACSVWDVTLLAHDADTTVEASITQVASKGVASTWTLSLNPASTSYTTSLVFYSDNPATSGYKARVIQETTRPF